MKHPIRISLINLSLLGILVAGCKKQCSVENFSVKAGKDQTILAVSDSVSLTGLATGITPSTSFLWTTISGPTAPTIGNSASLKTYATNLTNGTYVFQLTGSNNQGNIALDTTTVFVDTGYIKTITIQPGSASGQDADVTYVPGLYNGNDISGNQQQIFKMMEWTYSGVQGTNRSFLKFTALDTITFAPKAILNASLTLFGADSTGTWPGDSYYPGSPYDVYGDNSCWLQRVTANWDQLSLTYNNQPGVTTVNEVAIPPSTSQYGYDVIDLNVTSLIQNMTATPGTNFGFCMRLQNESVYRAMAFKTSKADADSSTGPKLIVTYKSLYP